MYVCMYDVYMYVCKLAHRKTGGAAAASLFTTAPSKCSMVSRTKLLVTRAYLMSLCPLPRLFDARFREGADLGNV